MKKIIFTAFVAFVASTSFAQDIVKELKGKNFSEAVATLNAALPNLSAEQKAKGYALLTDIVYKEASKAYDIAQINQTTGKNDPVDYDSMLKAIELGIICEQYDNEPNDKGKIAPKFHKKNYDRLSLLRNSILGYGQTFLNKDNALALKYLSCYVNSSSASLFADVAGGKDPYVAPIARVCGLIAYQAGDYKEAASYAKIAINDPAEQEEAQNVYIASLEKQLETREDTINFVNTLKETNAKKYFSSIVTYLNRIGETEAASKIIDDEIAASPDNKLAYALKGDNAMNARDMDKAIENFKKAVEIDPAFTIGWSLLGACSSQKAYELQEQLSTNGRLTMENAEKVNAVLNEAKGYYEKVRELDPNHEQVSNWPYQLRMLYNALGESDKAAEITKMLGE